MIRVALVTVSDSCARGTRQDRSTQVFETMLPATTFEICERRTVPDDKDAICSTLVDLADRLGADLVLTAGGTGLGPRDVTPEATGSVCQRLAPGFGELMRMDSLKQTPNAILSRATAGVRGKTLIINFPGSPRAVRQCLKAVLGVLPHAVEMMHGGGHPQEEAGA